MKQKQFFLVFNVPPESRHYWPMWADNKRVLWFANLSGRKNATRTPTVFSSKEDAQKAILATNKYAEEHNYILWQKKYIIQSIFL